MSHRMTRRTNQKKSNDHFAAYHSKNPETLFILFLVCFLINHNPNKMILNPNKLLFFVLFFFATALAYRDFASVDGPKTHSVIVTYSEPSFETLGTPMQISVFDVLVTQFEIYQIAPEHVLVFDSDTETVSSVLDSHFESSSVSGGPKILAIEQNRRVSIHAVTRNFRFTDSSLAKPGGKVKIHSSSSSSSSLTKPGGKVKVHGPTAHLKVQPSKFSPQFVQPTSSSTPAPWHLDILDGYSGDNTNAIDGYYSSTVTGNENPVNVYVIDTGVDTAVGDLGGRVDFLADILGDSDSSDCNGHGTLVADMVTGTTRGSAKGVAVKSIRALDCDGSNFVSDIIVAIQTAIDHSTSAKKVINLSLGSTGPSIGLDTKIQYARSRGAVVIVSAGNDGANACDFSPSRSSYAIAVGSHTPDADISVFSNTGSCVDLYAPGEPIEAFTTSDVKLIVSGTSFAAPLVSGLAAMVFAHYPSSTDSQVVTLLTSDAFSAKGVLFAKNPFPSPAELTGAPDIGTNVPDSGAATSFHATTALVFLSVSAFLASFL